MNSESQALLLFIMILLFYKNTNGFPVQLNSITVK